jgi:hypothetical protein
MLHDEITKRQRGYADPNSVVRFDGSEILVGKDWKKRKEELARRCGGQCEWKDAKGQRCRSAARDPHHVIPRSKRRDDRLENLLGLCGLHHDSVDWKKLHWSKTND